VEGALSAEDRWRLWRRRRVSAGQPEEQQPRGHPLAVRTGPGAPGTPVESKLRYPGGKALLRASPASWRERSRRMVGTAGEATAATPQVCNAEQARQAPREALLLAARPGCAQGERGASCTEQIKGTPAPRQPRSSRKPSSGTRKRGTSGGRDGNHGGRSAEGGRRTRRGIRSSSSWPDALAPIGRSAWQAPRDRRAASRSTAPASLPGIRVGSPGRRHACRSPRWSAALPAAGQGDLEVGTALVIEPDHLQGTPLTTPGEPCRQRSSTSVPISRSSSRCSGP
jgi:hypothetical protein